MSIKRSNRPRILLLSAYHSKSHAYWCEGMMAALPEYEWVLKTQPARHFSWRVRASEWIWGLDLDPDFDQAYDLIIATSLSGIAGFKVMRPHLAQVPVWVYFHENQFAHPLEDRQSVEHQVSWQFSSLQNALCADWVSFNTAFNRDTFFAGLRKLLKRMPERLPGDPLGSVEACSNVLPVPLDDELLSLRNAKKDPRLIVWNHRWEWDKQPQVFLDTLVALRNEGVDFRLAMLGSGGADDERFEKERLALGDAIVHWGEVTSEDYRNWLGRAGVGVSTAVHDFQGLAILELALAGATIVAPRRVAYPECVPEAVFYEGSSDDPAEEARALQVVLQSALNHESPQAHSVEKLPVWKMWTDRYRERIEQFL